MRYDKAQSGKGRNVISPRQIKIIHTLKGVMGMGDEDYRAMLQEFAGVASSKNLTWRQADELIADMQRKTGKQVQEKAEFKTRHNSLAKRPGMATPPQLRKIEAIWVEVSKADGPENRAKALRAFIERVAKVSDLRFLDRTGASAVITALEAMAGRRQ